MKRYFEQDPGADTNIKFYFFNSLFIKKDDALWKNLVFGNRKNPPLDKERGYYRETPREENDGPCEFFYDDSTLITVYKGNHVMMESGDLKSLALAEENLKKICKKRGFYLIEKPSLESLLRKRRVKFI